MTENKKSQGEIIGFIGPGALDDAAIVQLYEAFIDATIAPCEKDKAA